MAMLRTILLLFTIFSLGKAAGIGFAADESCPYGWTPFGVQCYKVISQTANWATAEKNCQSLGGNLASVRSKSENEFLLNLVSGSTRTWIGGHDGEQEGQWFWSDGSEFDYMNWCSGEPNNAGVENCLEINWSGNRCWNDASCSSALAFICAKGH